jgi:hypothetical protein
MRLSGQAQALALLRRLRTAAAGSAASMSPQIAHPRTQLYRFGIPTWQSPHISVFGAAVVRGRALASALVGAGR